MTPYKYIVSPCLGGVFYEDKPLKFYPGDRLIFNKKNMSS